MKARKGAPYICITLKGDYALGNKLVKEVRHSIMQAREQ